MEIKRDPAKTSYYPLYTVMGFGHIITSRFLVFSTWNTSDYILIIQWE